MDINWFGVVLNVVASRGVDEYSLFLMRVEIILWLVYVRVLKTKAA